MLDNNDDFKDQRFTRERRFLTPAHFKRHFKMTSRRIACFPFELWLAPKVEEKARLGLTIAKRQVPKAVSRNAIRRIIREWFRCEDCQEDVWIKVLAKVKKVEQDDKLKWAKQLKSCWNQNKRS